MTQRRLWVTLFVVSIIVTLIGLGFAVYNYSVFDKPFMTTSTKGLLAAFFLCATMVAINGSIISVVGKTTVEIIELFECRQKVP